MLPAEASGNGRGRLSEVVRTGRPVAWELSEDFSKETAQAMRLHGLPLADRLARAVPCPEAGRMLDLGGGVGTHAFAFARRHPGLEVVIFDRNAQALRLAEEEVRQSETPGGARRLGLQGRVSVRLGDMFADDLGRAQARPLPARNTSGQGKAHPLLQTKAILESLPPPARRGQGGDYGLVLLASVLCTFGAEENRRLLKRVGGALREGGRVVVCDALVDASLTRPPAAALFGVHMLLTTPAGWAYAADEVSAWLAEAGFTDLTRLPLPPAQVLMGRK